jgi:hypothetical protein
MNYKILWDKNRTRLEQKVIDELNNGWELQGGASMAATVTQDKDGKPVEVLVWCQAVIKRGK